MRSIHQKVYILRHNIVLVKVNVSYKVDLLKMIPHSKCTLLSIYTHNGHIGYKEWTKKLKYHVKIIRVVGGL